MAQVGLEYYDQPENKLAQAAEEQQSGNNQFFVRDPRALPSFGQRNPDPIFVPIPASRGSYGDQPMRSPGQQYGNQMPYGPQYGNWLPYGFGNQMT